MSRKTWLYIYENSNDKRLYIGIGKSMGRVFQPHNPEAEDLRDASGTLIRQTIEPFSTREDALKAEAIAIHVAALTGMTPIYDSDQEDELYNSDQEDELYDSDKGLVTNIRGVQSTKFLGPAIFVKEGNVRKEDLTGAIIVPISPEEIEGRATAFGANPGEIFAERAVRWWNIDKMKRPKITQLIAVLTGSRRVILGSWKVDPKREWVLDPNHKSLPTPYNKRVTIPIVSPKDDDFRGIKGMTYFGRLNQGVSYSPDISSS